MNRSKIGGAAQLQASGEAKKSLRKRKTNRLRCRLASIYDNYNVTVAVGR